MNKWQIKPKYQQTLILLVLIGLFGFFMGWLASVSVLVTFTVFKLYDRLLGSVAPSAISDKSDFNEFTDEQENDVEEVYLEEIFSDSTTDPSGQLSLASGEVDQIKELIHDAVEKLSDSFHSLNSITSNQQSLLGDVFDTNQRSDSGTFRNFIQETEKLLGFFVDTLVDTSKDSVYLMECVDNMNDRVNSVLKLLDEVKGIASDISLLSLNASIEAARAGEAGRGFSVVAHEIRNLSNKSDQVSDQINTISKEVVSTLSTVREVVDKVASTDMDLALNSKEKVSEMTAFASERNQRLESVIQLSGAMTEDISMATNQAVMSLQFEDMCRQLLDHVEKRLSATNELVGHVKYFAIGGHDEASIGAHMDKVKQLQQELIRLKPKLVSMEHKAVTQESVDSGDIELF